MLAMGRKGQLPEQFAEVDERSGAPKLACVVLAVITVVGPFLGKNMLIPLTNVSALAFIFSCTMVALACLKMRYTEPDLPRPYKVPGGKFGICPGRRRRRDHHRSAGAALQPRVAEPGRVVHRARLACGGPGFDGDHQRRKKA